MKKAIIVLALAAVAAGVGAQSLSQNFANVPTLFTTGGWLAVNNSVQPGTTWIQGDSVGWFPGPGGTSDNNYALAPNEATAGTDLTGDTISLWMLTPVLTFVNGSTISFQTISLGTYADRMQVSIGTNGSDSNVGTLPEDVGTYTHLLLDVNPTEAATGYPTTWTTENLTVSGLSGPTTTRLAFRYYVHNGGFDGSESNGIGVTNLLVAAPVPEPASIMVIGLGIACLMLRRRS